MIAWLAAALLTGSALAASPVVEVGTGDWSNIPALSSRGFHHITSSQVDMLHSAFESSECAAGKRRSDRLNLEVPFLVQFDDAGALKRVVIQKMDCTPAEGVIAGAVLRLVNLGEHRATGENLTGWYRGAIRVRSS